MGNFLTTKQLKENKILRHLNSIFFFQYLLIFILILVLTGQMIFWFFKVKIENPSTDSVKQEYAVAVVNNSRLLQLKTDFTKARANHVDAIDIINVVSKAMNENIWVKKIQLTSAKITISGNVNNADALNAFFAKLQFVGYEKPIIENTKLEENTISFTIVAEKGAG